MYIREVEGSGRAMDFFVGSYESLASRASRRRDETRDQKDRRQIYFQPGVSSLLHRRPHRDNVVGRCIRAHVVEQFPKFGVPLSPPSNSEPERSIVPEDPIKLFPELTHTHTHDRRLRSTSANVKLIAGRRSPKRRRVLLSSVLPRAVSPNSVCHSRSGMITYFYDAPQATGYVFSASSGVFTTSHKERRIRKLLLGRRTSI